MLGSFGEPAQVLAHRLLDDNAVTVIASDGHNNGARQPALKQAFEYIVQRYDRERAEQLIVHTHPCRHCGRPVYGAGGGVMKQWYAVQTRPLKEKPAEAHFNRQFRRLSTQNTVDKAQAR